MNLPNKTVRGLKAIRTHFGKLTVPDTDFLFMTRLEKQKSLRETERAKLLKRFEVVDSRLRFIESKKAEILCRLGLRPSRQMIEAPMRKLRAVPPPIPGRRFPS